MDTIINEFNRVCQQPKTDERTVAKLECLKAMVELVASASPSPTYDASDASRTEGHIVAHLATWYALNVRNDQRQLPSAQEFRQLCSFKTHTSLFIQDYTRYLINNVMTSAVMRKCTVPSDVMYASLIGQCVGDALGFLVEGKSRQECTQYVHTFMANTHTIPTEIRCGFAYGQYSDDSELAREAYIAYVQNKGKLDPLVYGLRMSLLFQPNAFLIVGYGYTTANACIAIREGKTCDISGSPQSSGNGSAMRSAPIGLLHNWEEIPAKARECGALTHASPRCLDGSVLIACACRYIASTRNYPFDAEHFIKTLTTRCKDNTWATDMPLHLDRLLQKYKNNMGCMEVADWVISVGLADGESDWHGTIGCGVLQSTLWSIYCFMYHPDNFVACMGLTIQPGGDVDTTAAMAGALSGARVPLDRIPKAWIDPINDKGEWGPTQLRTLVDNAYTLANQNQNRN